VSTAFGKKRRDNQMKRIALLAAMLMMSHALAQQVEISISEPNGVRLDWQAIPGKTYSVHSTPSLLPSTWTNATPYGLTASNVLGGFETVIPDQTLFFRIFKEDTDPPTVTELLPKNDAIAVSSNAPVTIILDDETGIDTNSIILNVGSWTNLSLASSMLTWSNQTLTFNPTSVLGEAGAIVSNVLTIADTLGHTLNNYTWTFQLGRPIVVTNTFLSLTAPPSAKGPQVMSDGSILVRRIPGVHPLDGTDEYHIVAVTSNTVLFSYTTTPPTVTEGMALVSFDAAYPFYRTVESFTHDAPNQECLVETTDLSLLDLMTSGSAVIMNGHKDFGGDLSGTVLYDGSALTLHLPSASWALGLDAEGSFDIDWGQLQTLDAFASGTLTLHLTPEAIFHEMASPVSGSTPLAPPVTKVIGAMAGHVPIWIEVIVELNARYEYGSTLTGNAHTTVNATDELTFSVHLRDGQWSRDFDGGFTCQAEPIEWDLEGTANVKIYIQPKLTVLVYSLAGPWVDINPYAELDLSHYQSDPLEYDLALYFGLSSTWGITTRVPFVPEAGPWDILDVKELIWSDSYPTDIAPTFLSDFPDRTVTVGNTLTLFGYANGTPAPTYKWYYNGSKIVGEIGPEYEIVSANSGHVGTYSVRAQNSAGSVQTSCVVNVTGDPSHHLVAYYPFENNANDASGNGNHGSENVSMTYSSGHNGLAVEFHGSPQRIQLPPSVISGTDVTFSLWLRATSGGCLISGARAGADNEYIAMLHNHESLHPLLLYYHRSGGSGPSYTTDVSVSDDIWHMLTVVTVQSQTKIYVDGALAQTVAIGSVTPLSIQGLWLGAEQDSVNGGFAAAQHFVGKMDDVRIYNRALSESEIQGLYNGE